LTEINERLGGLLDRIQTPTSFGGTLGETLLMMPATGKMPAKGS
jgi:hypothetical protein